MFVGDVVRANLAALDVGLRAAPVNIGTGVETNVVELYARIMRTRGGPRQGPCTRAAKDGEVRRSVLSCDALAERVLGWKPQVSLDEGLAAHG